MLSNDQYLFNRVNLYLSEVDQRLQLSINRVQLEELALRIQSLECEWENFSELLKEITGCGRVMNRSALANPYSIMTEINLSNGEDSLLVLLSALGDFYGFYFYSHTKKASWPVRLYKRKRNERVEIIQWEDPQISYFPFSEEQQMVVDQVETRLGKSFPGFVRFNSDLAVIPIYDIRIREEFYPKLDLFQVVFIYEPVCF